MKSSRSVSRLSVPKLPAAHRIFLVDDHPVTRQGLFLMIEQEADLVVCGEADSAPLAIELIPEIMPDLAIIDVALNTASGIDLVRELKTLVPALPTLALSMHEESLNAERALRAGARGFVMKREPVDVILGAIRRVLAGDIHLSERMRTRFSVATRTAEPMHFFASSANS